jgi:hypothetical protein
MSTGRDRIAFLDQKNARWRVAYCVSTGEKDRQINASVAPDMGDNCGQGLIEFGHA